MQSLVVSWCPVPNAIDGLISITSSPSLGKYSSQGGLITTLLLTLTVFNSFFHASQLVRSISSIVILPAWNPERFSSKKIKYFFKLEITGFKSITDGKLAETSKPSPSITSSATPIASRPRRQSETRDFASSNIFRDSFLILNN